MDKHAQERQKKLLEAKMLLDTFEIPKRPTTLSAHQFKKKFGTSIGYAEYKRGVRAERDEWDRLYKEEQKVMKLKIKHLSNVSLSDEALIQADEEAKKRGLSIPEILGEWIEKGRFKF
ncbi:MAG: hypothetical protein NE328_13550 [Lentisphaeraceae bacterium]|nr:hypothetical protein [Lentisphaeraceae bacterium]